MTHLMTHLLKDLFQNNIAVNVYQIKCIYRYPKCLSYGLHVHYGLRKWRKRKIFNYTPKGKDQYLTLENR